MDKQSPWNEINKIIYFVFGLVRKWVKKNAHTWHNQPQPKYKENVFIKQTPLISKHTSNSDFGKLFGELLLPAVSLKVLA